MIAIVTNIDNDHLATHDGDFARLKQSFVEFLHNLPFYGLAVLCAEDENLREHLAGSGGAAVRHLRVSIRRHGRARGERGACRPGRSRFDAAARRATNRCRSPSTCRAATTCSIRWPRWRWRPNSSIDDARHPKARSLNFQGIDRRLQQLGDLQLEPAAVRCAGRRLRSSSDRGVGHARRRAAGLARLGGLVLAFQPHRFSRTRDSAGRFRPRCSSDCDVLLVTEVYAAGEAPIAGADGRAICRAVRTRAVVVEPVFVERVDDLAESLRAVLRDGDVVLTMGAGNIGAVAHELREPSCEARPAS